MPVISPRRSSTSGSGSLYGTTSSPTTGGALSSLGSSGYSSVTSYLDRANSLSKTSAGSSSSSYNPSYNKYLSSSYASSYTPRTSAYRNSTSSSSYLSGGSSGLGTYRSTSSYLSAGSNDTTSSSRYGYGYGLNKKSKPFESTTLTRNKDIRDSRDDTSKKPPSGTGSGSGSSSGSDKRLTGSNSSSSLARLVATSGLDMYEKYSPAHYKPNCELSRSRSAVAADASEHDSDAHNESAAAYITLDRPRTRYSRLYSAENNNNENKNKNENENIRSSSINRKYNINKSEADVVDNISSYSSRASRRGKLQNSATGSATASTSTTSAGALSNSNSSGDIPTATFTLRSKRLSRAKIQTDDDDAMPKNGVAENCSGSNGIETFKDMKLSSSTDNIATSLSVSSRNEVSAATANNNNASTEDAAAVSSGNDGDVSTSATLKLDTNLIKGNKVRTSIRSALPPPSPTASRYWDRDSSGTKTTTTSSYSNNSAADVETNKSSTSSSDAKDEGLCGLRNIGNTCFMNSVIQCLSHTSELTKFLRTHNGLRSSSSKDQQILHEFAKLIREMWTSNVHSVTPLELKRAFSTKHRMYSDYNQQDAQEFLRFFLDSLHSALNTGVKGELLKIDDNQSDNKKADQTWEWYARHENSLIRDLFVGQLKSTLKCTTCGNTSVTFDPFWDLSVSLPSSSRCKLDACLDMFIREEILDGDEMPTCSKCQTRRRCTKSFAIQRFPKYLVIHLKRFSETRWSKLSNIVEFPTGERELNMRTYGSNPNANIYYSLYAISNHMGSTAGGHYVALCKHPVTKKWHEFNDNIVSDALSENHLVSSSAYILFYERV